MFRLAVAAVVASAACNQTDNDRPATLQYITEAILQPNCSQDVCHSSYTRTKGYAFDTVAAARQSLSTPGVVNTSEPESSLLYTVLIRQVKRMPYDAPLPDKDIELILRWIMGSAQTDLDLNP
ncbi:MAG TPA: hypothetical protein VHT91_23385 [Kofleriaceae bacterium]|nr:hypothetical protein [Kofleriaceae bacterium]